MSERKTWLLVFPVFTHVLPEAFEGFLDLAYKAGRHCTAYDFAVTVPKRMLLHQAMNAAAEAVADDPKFAGFITFDDDCLPPPEAIQKLIAHHEAGKPMVSGLGYMRGFPYTPTLARYFDEGATLIEDPITGDIQLSGFTWLEQEAVSGEVVSVDFCGMPITLVGRDVLLKLERPFFQNWLEGGSTTHDVYFCRKVRDAGVSIYVDTTIDCGHLVAQPIVNKTTRAHVLRAAKQATTQGTVQRMSLARAV